MAVGVGLPSPLIAAAMPIAGLALFVDIRYGRVFPTGALTVVLVRAWLSIGERAVGMRRSRPSACRMGCRPDIAIQWARPRRSADPGRSAARADVLRSRQGGLTRWHTRLRRS